MFDYLMRRRVVVLLICLAVLGLTSMAEAALVSRLAAGYSHSIVLNSDGKLYAWGNNDYGQLGNGNSVSRAIPTLVNMPVGVSATAVATGKGYHHLALGSDGKLYAWGRNNYGQLGDGSTIQRSTPVLVNLPVGVSATAVAVGEYHSLALGSNGKLYAWGFNAYGQLGDSSTINRTTPVLVNLPVGVSPTVVVAGQSHTFALGNNGKLYAWGDNTSGKLGDGSATRRSTPVLVSLPTGVSLTPVAAGSSHSLALGNNGKLYAWGSNYFGQLGDGSTTNRSTPVVVNLPFGVSATAVAAGSSHSLAIGSDGKLYVWGSNEYSQLGDSRATNRSSPAVINLPAGVNATAVAAGSFHSLILGSDGKLYAWGFNSSGQLGDGSAMQRSSPVAVSMSFGPQTITFPALSSKTLGALPFTLTATASSGLAVSLTSLSPTVCAVSGNTVTLLTMGICRLQANQVGNGSYEAATAVTQTFMVNSALAGGEAHNILLGSDGKLYAWGSNNYGQLGDGSATNRSTPVLVNLPVGVNATAVVAGTYHSLALGSDGKLYAWGYNNYGQLGDGSTTQRSTPVLVNLPVGVTATAVVAGDMHSLALGSDGKLYAWGTNWNGQLGDGSTTDRSTPVLVSLPAGVSLAPVAAGNNYSLALGSNSKLYAWGGNGNGELGDGSKTSRSTPVLVNLPTGVSATTVVAGTYHSLALGSDGKLYAWGFNFNGQLGDGSATNRSTPVLVNLPAGVSATTVGAGGDHSLALGSDGNLYAWGYNSSGQLGDGSTMQRSSPVAVSMSFGPQTITFPALSSKTLGAMPFTVTATASSGLAVSLTSLSPTVCAVSGNTVTLHTMGACRLQARQAGNGSYTAATTVTQSIMVNSALAGGATHSLALNSDGKLFSWGRNNYGLLGDGSTMGRTTPVLVSLPDGVSASVVAAGGVHQLAQGSDGKLYAWGSNEYGQLGDGSTTQSTTRRLVNLPTDVSATAVAVGGFHSLALGSDGKLYAWGYNNYGQLGDGSITNRSTPVLVNLPAGVSATAVVAGDMHSLALGSDGNLYAWGYNDLGQLGDGSTTGRTTPVLVNLPAGVSAMTVAGGNDHSLALGSNGKVYGWGDNARGQLGDGSTMQRTIPVVVSLPAGLITAVVAGDMHSLALGSDGELYAWGGNFNGQLGDGSATNQSTPVLVNLPAGVSATAVAAGYNHSLALDSNGAFYAWGYNAYGQLGDGSTTNRSTPVLVSFSPPLSSQTITFPALISKTLGVMPFTVTATASSGLAVSLTSLSPTVCAVTGNVVNLLAVGTCSLAANQSGDGSYLPAPQVVETFNIVSNTTAGSNVIVAPVDPTTGNSVITMTFESVASGGQTTVTSGVSIPATPQFQAECLPPVTLDVTTTVAYSGDITVCVNPSQLGSTCPVHTKLWHWNGSAWEQLPAPATVPSGMVCGITSSLSPFTLLASKQSQVISFDPLGNKTLGDAPFLVAVTANSGLPVTVISLAPSICGVSGNSVTLLSAGICLLEASQAGNGSYAAATSVVQTFEIQAGAVAGGGEDADVPLPLWALVLLGAGLFGAMRRRMR